MIILKYYGGDRVLYHTRLGNDTVKSNTGHMESVWLPNTLFDITEETRKKIGMNRSAFYRYAITRLLQEMSILSTKAKEVPNDGE